MTKLRFDSFPVVLAAPSGTGKTTIARALVAHHEGYAFSVSATTRPPREGERDGIDYHFVDDESFTAMIGAGELVEWAEVHGFRYGTPRSELRRAAEHGEYVVLDIDVQGARQIRDAVPEAVLVFVFPPSAEALATRLARRGTDTSREIRRRLRGALVELDHAPGFDYVVVNRDVEAAVEAVRTIVEAERHRAGRVRDLAGDVKRLQNEVEAVLEGGVEVGGLEEAE